MSRFEPSSEARLEGYRAGQPDLVPPSEGVRITPPGGGKEDGDWTQIAQRCWRTSTDFFDASLRRKLIDAQALWNSEHPMGSKYNHPEFAKRSRLFVPKTRTLSRAQEAAAAVAFFGTEDSCTITPPNPADQAQRQAARAQQEIVNHRLATTTPWYQFVIGGYQDAFRNGFVLGRTDWEYRESQRYFRNRDELGQEVRDRDTYVSTDRPMCTLIPPENLRVDPGCDWMDPIRSSPYLVETRPMYICDIKERMENERLNNGVRYRKLSDGTLLSGLKHSWDTIRQRRERSRQDRYEQVATLHDHMICWVHRNIVRIEGEDYVYETVGTEFMLSDPVPLAHVDPRGYRPYVFGYLNMESHNPFPDGLATLNRALQDEQNEVRNMRLDNTKLATYGRYMVRRGASIDLTALGRFTPGSSVEVQDINRDVRWDKSPEVGRGAYEEQDRLNIEMDELTGNFSHASQQTGGGRRSADPLLGTMMLLDANANKLVEYGLVTFCRTFVQPALKQITDLVRIWETDDTLAAVVGTKLGMDPAQVFAALNLDLEPRVNVGFGSTNGQQRVMRLTTGLQAMGQIMPQTMMGADASEIANEIFGALGYRSADRFFPQLTANNQDGKYKALEAEVQRLQQEMAVKQPELNSRIQIATINAQAKVQIENLRLASKDRVEQALMQFKMYQLTMERDLAIIDAKIAQEQNDIDRNRLYMEREALSNTIQMAEREFQLKVQTTLVAPPPHAQIESPPASSRNLIASLTRPGSGPVQLEKSTAGQGDDQVGMMARGRFGSFPNQRG